MTTDYVLGLGGEQVTEMQHGAWQHTNVFAGGQLLATYDAPGLHFYLNDPLGTRRAQTNYAGNLEKTCSSLPFGDDLRCSGSTTNPTEHHFTGKERDDESGLDDFGARYYASNMGRWMSPDWSATPASVPFADLGNPQSLNLYSYVLNNPLRMVDADGHDGCAVSGIDVDCNSLTSDAEAYNEAEAHANELLDANAQREQAQQQTADGAKASAQSAGAVSSQKLGKVWFNAYGGSAAERSAQLAAMSQDLTTTDRGGQMLTALEGRKSGFLGLWGDPKPFDIIQWANPTGSYSTQGGNFIVLDPRDIGAGYTSAMGGGTYSLQRIFALMRWAMRPWATLIMDRGQ